MGDQPTATAGRRARKKEATRQALLDAGRRLFAERGYRETRVGDIADAADVSEATFFRYFGSKEDLALTGIKGRVDEVVAELEARPVEEPPLAACRAVLESSGGVGLVPAGEQLLEIQLLVGDPGLAGHFFWHVTTVTSRLADDFGRRLGTSPDDLAPRLLANAVIGALNAVLQVWMADPLGVDPWALTRRALDDLGRGLEDGRANPPAAARRRRQGRSAT
ncbi:MAG: TetR family transcriptional regulator [Acidimicrobiales bacterium]